MMRRPRPQPRLAPLLQLLLVLLLAAALVHRAGALTEYLDAAAIARTEHAPDDGIHIEASPSHLARGGLFVTVEWSGVTDPTEGDFVAAYAPLAAEPQTTAPIKYQYAAAADAEHLRMGAGRVKFRLLEYVGGSYWFGFFRGNASRPVLAARSGPVSVGGSGGGGGAKAGAPPEPQGVHLALTDKADEMRVTWKTPESFFFIPDAEPPGSDETAADAAVAAAASASAGASVAVGVDGQGNGEKEEEVGGGVVAAVAVVEDKPAAAAGKGKRKGKGKQTRRRIAAAASMVGTQEVQYVEAAKASDETVSWSSTKASTSSFARADLCGEPATGVGFTDPGSTHTAVMRGLEPGTSYAYRVGNAEHDVWSETYTFTTPQARGGGAQATTRNNGPLTRVAVMADMSSAESDGSLQAGFYANDVGSLDTARAVTQLVQGGEVDFALCVGDLSYSTGFVSRWDAWMEMMQPIAARVPLMTTPGNHERDDAKTSPFYADGTTSLWARNEAGGECGVPYAVYFPMPGPAAFPQDDQPWYSFKWGALHFTVMSTEHDFRDGSLQHAWLQQDLAAVDREQSPWLVLVAHRPFYLDSTDDANPDDPLSPSEQNGARLLRKHVEPLLLQHRVDLVLSGHHHSYQRTAKVANGARVAPAAHVGSEYKAPVHVVLGTAGRRLSTNFETTVPTIFEAVHGSAYGAVVLEADASQLSLTFRDALTDAVVDQVFLHLPLEHGAEEENDDEAYHKNKNRGRTKKRAPAGKGKGGSASASLLLRLLGLVALIALVAVVLGYASGTLGHHQGAGAGAGGGGVGGAGVGKWMGSAGFRPKSQSSPRPPTATEMTPLVTGAGSLDGSGSGSGSGEVSKRYRTGSVIRTGYGDSAV